MKTLFERVFNGSDEMFAIDADRKGLSPYDCSPQALEEIRAIKARIDQE